jgi:hypothetical protein
LAEPIRPITTEPIRPITTRRDAKSLPELVNELRELIFTYLKQETLDPLKALGRFVAYGLAGAICLSLGTVLIGVGGLRVLETEGHVHLGGNLSWAPYLIIVAVCAVVAVLAVSRIGRAPQGRRR